MSGAREWTQALENAPAGARHDAKLQRILVDVELDGRTELVVLELHDGRLAARATDGRPDSPFIEAALALFARSGSRSAGPASERVAPGPPVPQKGSEPLAQELVELVTAVARAGASRHDSPLVRDALARVSRATKALSALRWVGRVEEALATRDTLEAGRLLEGAMRWVERQPRVEPSDWVPSAECERLVDRTFVEIGREQLDGHVVTLERRYMMELGTGEVFAEERSRGEPAPSLGPASRTVLAGYAEASLASVPRRLALRQYTLELGHTESTFERLRELATEGFSVATESALDALDRAPALAEPVIVIRLESVAVDAIPIARGASSHARRLLDGDGLIVLRAVPSGEGLAWMPVARVERSRVVRA
jgi:hypothetical protein